MLVHSLPGGLAVSMMIERPPGAREPATIPQRRIAAAAPAAALITFGRALPLSSRLAVTVLAGTSVFRECWMWLPT
jgi:hypothetical protein